jgi:hypothetical protein
MNKKGFFLLPDMTWFLLFIIASLLIFFFLFKPLENNTENRVITEYLRGDAAHTAFALARMRVDQQYDLTLPPAASTTPTNSIIRFSDAARAVVAAHHEVGDDNLGNTLEAFYYNRVLNAAFLSDKNAAFWEKSSAEKRYPIRYAVIIREGDTFLPATCREYLRPGTTNTFFDSGICDALPDKARDGPEINPEFYKYPESGLAPYLLDKYDVGTAFIPGENQPLYIHVLIEYEEEDE